MKDAREYIEYLEGCLASIRGALYDFSLSPEEMHKEIDTIICSAAESEERMKYMSSRED